jgi:hypothetical protein
VARQGSQAGKAVSRLLSPEGTAPYTGRIANRRRLEAVLAVMMDLSRSPATSTSRRYANPDEL